MRLSRFFLPLLKENPADAEIVSHRLMLRAGMIRQHASGIYNWLPLGYRVLRRIEQIVREEQDAAGAQEILMPTIQSAELWRESGRYEDYGKEMLRIKDRHDRDMLYGPTHEEVVTDVFRKNIHSYRDLPKILYQIHWKFRDEVRPRFGVMRGREFLMKDAYSFDLDMEAARRSYNRMFVAYLRTFRRMGLTAIPMAADSGPIGGDMSHEFIILADTGESAVFCHKALLEKPTPESVNYEGDLQPVVDEWTSLYAATDEKHTENHGVAPEDLISARGIEVGHIFNFGLKYSRPMDAVVQTVSDGTIPVQMGSYGIGVSRLVGAIIEASHDDAGIIWPDSVAPFHVGLINLKAGDVETDRVCAEIDARLSAAGVDVLYDDTQERPGAKFATMDLIGLPWQLIVGPRGLEKGVVELKRRATGERYEVSMETAIDRLIAPSSGS
ncbi:proline--tRNA ligase [Phaeovibrio sulfidiphilus]|uniref:Proline--tRNA ligase n=1 Tax=Phaeovibrio sulfidiphilus TaxID=1220600 RepID=A0A8J7CWU0_9PROT|nr:proline--tRNA ligase [Phaeovibrio sulfidiphilus]MBE1237921.1 proline--tRNA ligase [Phaeovibrio sulfidiphilus]